MSRLVVISNRVADPAKAAAGGLAVAMGDALRQTGGLWFGWSGKIVEAADGGVPGEGAVHSQQAGAVKLVTLDLSREDHDSFYAGYSNGEQAERCEAQGIVPHAPTNRAINNQGDGTLFDRRLFVYDEKTDTFRCPAGQRLVRRQVSRKDRCVMYAAEAQVCGACAMKNRCTGTTRRWITRHLHEGALQRMNERATAQLMRLRRCTVERDRSHC